MFADVVIGVPFDAAIGQGHAAADAVERALESALPEADVVVHVEPMESDAAVRERALAAALGVPRVREVHNVSVLAVGSGNELSLHLKLPGDLSLEEAHEVAEQVERAILEAVPEISAVQTHLEPLAEETPGRRPPAAAVATDRETVARIVRDATGADPEDLRFVNTDDGLVVYLTVRLGGDTRARRRARAGEPDRGDDPPRASRDRRRDRAHGAAAVRLCMFSPRDRDLPRGWPGRIDGDRVVQLAAQTLQSFFTGGGEAREHDDVRARRCRAARARAAPADRADLRQRRRLLVRELRRDLRARRRGSAAGRRRADRVGPADRRRDRSRGCDRRLHAHERLGRAGARRERRRATSRSRSGRWS